jgi:hypothetical protein
VSCLRAQSEELRRDETRKDLLWALKEYSRATREREAAAADDGAEGARSGGGGGGGMARDLDRPGTGNGVGRASAPLTTVRALDDAATRAAGVLFAGAMPAERMGGLNGKAAAAGGAGEGEGADAAGGDGEEDGGGPSAGGGPAAAAAGGADSFLASGSLAYTEKGASLKGAKAARQRAR